MTAVDEFAENDAVLGQTVATFTASDEEDGVLPVADGEVTFTGTTNDLGYYAFSGENVVLTQAGLDAINGCHLYTSAAADDTRTVSGRLPAQHDDIPHYVDQKSAPPTTVIPVT